VVVLEEMEEVVVNLHEVYLKHISTLKTFTLSLNNNKVGQKSEVF